MEKNLNELFRVDNISETRIEKSFERISKELMTNYSLIVNDSKYFFRNHDAYMNVQ